MCDDTFGTQIESVWGQGAEECIQTQEEGRNGALERTAK
jgi:hypothetical protein